MEQTAQVSSGQRGREESAGELQRFGANDELLDQAWDDHTGKSLNAKKVKEARQLGMEYYDKMHVFDKVPIAQCWERTGKAHLKARWVDIDKGTRYRGRWVAKQFKGSDSEEWFAATPPIEALRALISHTTSGPQKKKASMVSKRKNCRKNQSRTRKKSLEEQHRGGATLKCVCGESKPKGCLERTSVIPMN